MYHAFDAIETAVSDGAHLAYNPRAQGIGPVTLAAAMLGGASYRFQKQVGELL